MPATRCRCQRSRGFRCDEPAGSLRSGQGRRHSTEQGPVPHRPASAGCSGGEGHVSWWRNTMISRSFECPLRTASRASNARNRYRTRHMGSQDASSKLPGQRTRPTFWAPTGNAVGPASAGAIPRFSRSSSAPRRAARCDRPPAPQSAHREPCNAIHRRYNVTARRPRPCRTRHVHLTPCSKRLRRFRKRSPKINRLLELSC